MPSLFVSNRGLAVERYSPERKAAWDCLVRSGKNATFLFERDYADYHSDRFKDHSLMVWRASELLAVLPASVRNPGTLVSHEGLTYGGFVFKRDVSLHGAIDVMHAALGALHAVGVSSLIYKRIPRIYNTLPDDEVDYGLFLLGAQLFRRDIGLVIAQQDRLPFRRGKKGQINKGKRAGIRVAEDTAFAPYWYEVLTPRLMSRYGVKPVHSLAEIELLASRFPKNIRQFSAYIDNQIAAGITIYETPTVAHVQYSAIRPEGELHAALDVLLEWLIQDVYNGKRYFDFGICNEDEGRKLNHGLLQSKEGFGARGCAHDFYAIRTADHHLLGEALPSQY
jgi:hypothetical protein